MRLEKFGELLIKLLELGTDDKLAIGPVGIVLIVFAMVLFGFVELV